MQLECSICKNIFDSEVYIPMILCSDQHLCCSECLDQICKPNRKNECPLCRVPLIKENIKKFRYFQKWEMENKKKEFLEIQNKQLKKQIDVFSKKQSSSQTESTPGELNDKPKYQIGPRRCRFAMLKSQNDLTISMLQELIQNNIDPVSDEFLGLGSKEEQKGFNEEEQYLIKWWKNYYDMQQLSAYDQLALNFLQNPCYRQQVEWYNKIIEKNPSNYKALYGLAVTQHNNNNIKSAIKLYQMTIELKPDFEMPYEMLGFIYLDMKDYQKALQSAEQCKKRSPCNIFSHFISAKSSDPTNLATTRQKMSEILDLYSQYLRPKYEIALTYLAQKRYYKAEDLLNECIKQRQSYIEPYFGLIQVYIARNDYDLCIKTASQALKRKLNPEQRFSCYFNLGVAYQKIGKNGMSICNLEKCLIMKEYIDINIRFDIANLFFKQGEYQKALKQYKICHDGGLQDISQYHKICECLYQLQYYTAAIDWLTSWLSVQPQCFQIYKLYSLCFFQKKNYNLAIYWGEKCIERDQQKRQVIPVIIKSLQKTFRNDEALKKIIQYVNTCDLERSQFEEMEILISELNQKDTLNESYFIDQAKGK